MELTNLLREIADKCSDILLVTAFFGAQAVFASGFFPSAWLL
jgi:hypothetical protein